MSDYKKYKASLEQEMRNSVSNSQFSNPLLQKKESNSIALTNYTQEIKKSNYDEEIYNIIEVVKLLNNLAPLRMPIYNFNPEQINGEHYYRPDGSLLLIREYDGQIVRDYYVTIDKDNSVHTVSRILEHDKFTGRLKAKILPVERNASSLKTSITIFDEKINNKYTIMQLTEDGFVCNISEFSGKGKSFQTLFRNITTTKPVRYIEGKDSFSEGFSMLDCLFDTNGTIVRIKKYNNSKEVSIDYTKTSKNINVKTKRKD